MEQGRLFDPKKLNTSQFSTPEQRAPIQSASSRYMQERGMGDYTPVPSDRQADPVRGTSLFKAYKDAQDKPESDRIRNSYEALRKETKSQFDFMTRPEAEGGMGMSFESTDDDPYPSPQEMVDDVVTNKRIKVWGTRGSPDKHNYFTDDENDQFRAVHDVFGHAGVGGSFSRHGEEAAWESHRQMFSPEARPAMTSETRGQNSFLNFGGGGFPDQSGSLVELPEWAEETGKLPAAAPSKSRNKTRNLTRNLRLF